LSTYIPNFLHSVFRPQTSDIGITEHVEGDECKFAVWTGHYNGKMSASENKVGAVVT
jgi:hypothetical protein